MPQSSPRTACLALFLASQLLLLINLTQPIGYIFDEEHYVPAAHKMMDFSGNRNWEHPPLGKIIIGAGILIFGDEPMGWRFMSTLFGSISVAGIFACAFAIFKDQRIAIWAALATLFNQLLFVQARVGMLDIFLVGFMVWGIAAVCAALDEDASLRTRKKSLLFGGVMFGLAAACKWIAVVPWVLGLALLLIRRIWPKFLWRDTNDSTDIPNVRYLVASMFALPLIVYFSTFLWFLGMPGPTGGPFEMFWLQRDILLGHMSAKLGHYYASPWYEWPLMQRPMWWAWVSLGPWDRVVLLIGNHVILYSGLVAICLTTWRWIRRRSRTMLLCSIWYPAMLFCWAVIPRPVGYLHYYLPTALTLSFPVAYIFCEMTDSPRKGTRWLAWGLATAALLMFVVLFPVLSGMRIPAGLSPR
jgi:dolichyl-phosphate-mannose-protein mannosyltransferase